MAKSIKKYFDHSYDFVEAGQPFMTDEEEKNELARQEKDLDLFLESFTESPFVDVIESVHYWAKGDIFARLKNTHSARNKKKAYKSVWEKMEQTGI